MASGLATRWLADGVPPLTVSAWLGHSDPSVTQKRCAGQLEENSLAGLEIVRAAARRRAAVESSDDRRTTYDRRNEANDSHPKSIRTFSSGFLVVGPSRLELLTSTV